MGNKFVGAGKLFFKGYSKIFKGPQDSGKVATIGGVKPDVKNPLIKKKIKLLKDLGKTQRTKPEAFDKAGGDKLKKEVLAARTNKKKGGRIGFRKGTGKSGVPAMDIKSAPTKKLSEKQKKIARLAGDPRKIDKPDFAKLRNKNKKVI